MLKLRDSTSQDRPPTTVETGPMVVRRGRTVLPDLPTAILARMRGYVGGSYSEPLSGAAAILGYHPLQSATADELAAIQAEMDGMNPAGEGGE